jgi:hypothetical protein
MAFKAGLSSIKDKNQSSVFLLFAAIFGMEFFALCFTVDVFSTRINHNSIILPLSCKNKRA